MPSSDDSSSSVEYLGTTPPLSARAVSTHAATADTATTVASVVAAPTLTGPVVAERIPSMLGTERAVDRLCSKHVVPEAYTARPAGKLPACSPPPEGAVCVYAHMLEFGVRFPLHEFFCEVLNRFALAPSQLSPNGWLVLVGFLVLCHQAAVPLSLAVFLHFFSLVKFKLRGWYFFRCKNAARVLFARLPKCHKGWKDSFFFLTSPKPWGCPVRWGEPSSLADPVLTCQELKSVGKLLRTYGTTVDLRTYLCEKNLAAAFSSSLPRASPPIPATVRSTSTGAKGMDQSEKRAAVSASPAEKMKTEPSRDTPALSGKKRNQEEANSKLLGRHGTAVDLQTYLGKKNLAEAFFSSLDGESPLPPASVRSTCTGAKGTDQPTKTAAAASASRTEKVKTALERDIPALFRKKRSPEEVQEANPNGESRPAGSVRPTSTGAKGADQSAKKATAPSASQLEKVKAELGGHTSALSGKKRNREEASSNDGVQPGHSELNSLPADHNCSASCLCFPPGFDPKPRHLPMPIARDIHNAEKEAARKESMLQTVNCAIELKKKLAEQAAAKAVLEKKDAEVNALLEQLKQGKNGEFAAGSGV